MSNQVYTSVTRALIELDEGRRRPRRESCADTGGGSGGGGGGGGDGGEEDFLGGERRRGGGGGEQGEDDGGETDTVKAVSTGNGRILTHVVRFSLREEDYFDFVFASFREKSTTHARQKMHHLAYCRLYRAS